MLRQPFNLTTTNLQIQRVAEFVPNPLHYSHRSSLETLNPVHESFIGAAYIRIGVIYVTFVVGTFTQSITASNMPGSYAVIIAIGDADLNTTGDQAAEYSLAYTVTNAAAGGADATLAAGPKKLKATATFGASAANKKVAFTLENANGVVKTYYRKANASGVATFTLRFKGTFEVTASYGDAITDTVTLKK
jgi:hypothetical protein